MKLSDNLTDRQTDYNSIDLVKFICSILVVSIHIAPFGSSGEMGLISCMNYGVQNYLARIAVPFFFVSSGFFLYKKTSLKSFSFNPTKKYALRLFKLYIIWTLIYFPLSFKEFFSDEKGVIHAILSYIRNCIFTGSYSHLWYLNASIFAVLLISFLLYKRINPKKMIIVALFLYLIGLFAQSWFGFIAPLRELSPSFWSLLKLAQEIIVNTRDGLFEGFLFVGFGMLFAYYRFNISKKMSLVGFIISMLLMLIEVSLLKHFDFIRENDLYLFLIPASFFGFSFVYQIELPNNSIYKTLRTLSTLIYFLHPWVGIVVRKTFKFIYEPLSKTCLVFILTLVITIIGSLIIMKMSNLRKFKWLKNLYT